MPVYSGKSYQFGKHYHPNCNPANRCSPTRISGDRNIGYAAGFHIFERTI